MRMCPEGELIDKTDAIERLLWDLCAVQIFKLSCPLRGRWMEAVCEVLIQLKSVEKQTRWIGFIARAILRERPVCETVVTLDQVQREISHALVGAEVKWRHYVIAHAPAAAIPARQQPTPAEQMGDA